MYCTIRPISSMCPSSMIVGEPSGFTSAMLLPATSDCTLTAKLSASRRQCRAAVSSKPEGAGESSSRFRNARDEGLSIEGAGSGNGEQRRMQYLRELLQGIDQPRPRAAQERVAIDGGPSHVSRPRPRRRRAQTIELGPRAREVVAAGGDDDHVG